MEFNDNYIQSELHQLLKCNVTRAKYRRLKKGCFELLVYVTPKTGRLDRIIVPLSKSASV